MLAIRMQRTGRKGHPRYRVIVQDSRRTPSSGRLVYSLGNYDPHTKTVNIDKEKAEFYLKNGAQPSERVTSLLAKEGVSLPKWVKASPKKEAAIKNLDKLRKNRPAEEPADSAAEEQPAEASEPVEAVEEPANN